MNEETSHLREFGGFRLDARKKTLSHDGVSVPMPLKELELLCILLENRGELVTKEELLEKVWENSYVEESNLSRHIYLLRKTLKDFGESEEFIQNVPRRGYRFTGKVREAQNAELVIEKHTRTQTLIEIQEEPRRYEDKLLTANKRRRVAAFTFLLVALLGGFAFWQYNKTAAVSDIKSIAVMPFQVIGGENGNEHQGLGLADVLITRLSNIREINVRSTSAIQNFDNQDSIAFGKKLNVDAVLEGSIYRTNDKVRVTARLIRVDDSSPIWAGQFEKLLQDELRLQDEIALQVVDALALNLSGNEKNALTKRYTESADAYQLYQKGRYEWNKRNYAGMTEAQWLFRNAIERDQNFALAYVGLADTMATTGLAEAYIAVKKALELDPNLAEAHATFGFVEMFHLWRWREAETSFKKSIELNPNYATAHHWYAELLAIEGRNAEAKSEMLRALEINPLSHNFLADLGQIYYFNREYKEAEEYCRKALEIYPDFAFAHHYLYYIYVQTGEYDKALEEIIKTDKINSTFAGEAAELKKQRDASFDGYRKAYGQGGINGYLEFRFPEKPLEVGSFYFYAMKYAFLGENENALDSLEKACEGRAFLSAFVKADPIFDSLSDEPRYQEILRKMNL